MATTSWDATARASEKANEDGSKAGAALLAVVYATGLVTTNVFLYGHGISDFSVLKPRAIFTGAIVLCSLALFAFMPTLIISNVAKNRGVSKAWSPYDFLPLVGKLLTPLVIGVAVCWVIRGMRVDYAVGKYWLSSRDRLFYSFLAALQFYFAATISAVLTVQSVRSYRFAVDKSSFSGMANRWALFTFWGTALLLAVLWYIAVFAGFAYIVIPQQFGGGRPESFRLKIKQDSVPDVKGLGIKFLKGTNITEPLDVIHESDDFISVVIAYPFGAQGGEFEASIPTTLRLEKNLVEASIVDYFDLGAALTGSDSSGVPIPPQEH